MRDGAVVALEEVLAGDLPVRLELEFGAEPELECVDVDDLAESRRHVAEGLGKRAGADVGVDEDERAPAVDRDRLQRELAEVEAGLTVGARRRAQRAVQPVRPGVVWTLQRLALSRAACDD